MHHLSEQEIIRRESLKALQKMEINPYPAESFNVNITCEEIIEGFEKNPDAFQNIQIAGRIMSRRIMGAAAFAEIKDHTGRIQIYVKRDDICPEDDKSLYNEV